MLHPRVSIVVGDITRLAVDAIVNAANSSLLGGGGVDGAIHRAAGPGLALHCRTLGGCRTGEAKLTPGFQAPVRFIIHTVGPIWRGGDQREDDQLASCYRECLRLASENRLESMAFPAISTGIYGFPRDRAARIAVREICDFLADHEWPKSVTLVAYDDSTRQHLNVALDER